MIYAANLPETDPGIILACNQFAAQITPLLPMDGMANVLLEPGGSTSRVVYSWFNPAVSDQFLASRVATASTPPQRRRPSLRISLNGQEGLLGEVLIRGCKPGDYGQSPEGLVGRCADQLALALENIELRRRLNSNQEVNSAVRRVARAATPGVPIRRVFLRFATEVEALVEFQRLSVYLVSQESDLAICAFRSGQGVARRHPEESARLSSSGLGETAASGESRIFSDLSECETAPVWNQVAAPAMRSALLVPVGHGDVTVGMLLLEHRQPRSFGSVDQAAMEEVASALAPSIARMVSPNHPIATSNQPAQDGVQRQLAKIFVASQSLEEIFPLFVTTLGKLVPIDGAKICWIDPNGHDLRYLWASPGRGNAELESISENCLSIDTRLYFNEQAIGVLTVFRDRGKRFSFQDQTTLDQMGIQISPLVQAGRLYVHARRQAFRHQRLSRVEMPPTGSGHLTSLTRALAEQVSDIGQAEWSLAFICGHRPAGQSPVAGSIIHQEEFPEGLMAEMVDLADNCIDEGAPVRRSLHRGAVSAGADPFPAKGHPAQVVRDQSWKCLALPLMYSVEGSIVLLLGRSDAFPWTQEEIYLLEGLVREAANVIESTRQKDAEQLANPGRTVGHLKSFDDELLAEIAHSLRSPISSIKDLSGKMLQGHDGWTDGTYQEFLQIIVKESDRLDRVVSDLLATSDRFP